MTGAVPVVPGLPFPGGTAGSGGETRAGNPPGSGARGLCAPMCSQPALASRPRAAAPRPTGPVGSCPRRTPARPWRSGHTPCPGRRADRARTQSRGPRTANGTGPHQASSAARPPVHQQGTAPQISDLWGAVPCSALYGVPPHAGSTRGTTAIAPVGDQRRSVRMPTSAWRSSRERCRTSASAMALAGPSGIIPEPVASGVLTRLTVCPWPPSQVQRRVSRSCHDSGWPVLHPSQEPPGGCRTRLRLLPESCPGRNGTPAAPWCPPFSGPDPEHATCFTAGPGKFLVPGAGAYAVVPTARAGSASSTGAWGRSRSVPPPLVPKDGGGRCRATVRRFGGGCAA